MPTVPQRSPEALDQKLRQIFLLSVFIISSHINIENRFNDRLCHLGDVAQQPILSFFSAAIRQRSLQDPHNLPVTIKRLQMQKLEKNRIYGPIYVQKITNLSAFL
jgi:hypothetical protein